MIGSHDAASFSIKKSQPYSAIARCQNWNTTQQLEAGVRILDIRIASSTSVESRIAIWHGCVRGGDFVETVLQPVHEFVERHPEELIVIQLVPEYGRDFPIQEKIRSLQIAKDTLGANIIRGGYLPELLQSWTLGDLRNRPGARIVVLVHNRFFAKPSDHRFNESIVLKEFGFAPMEKWLRCLWFNTRDEGTLLEYALDEVSRYGRHKRQFHASQLVLTPGVGSFADVVAALVGINKLRPASLACSLYGQLGRYFRLHASQGWNWVLLDFVDLGPWIICFLTALNFPIQFKLHLAVYDDAVNHVKTGRNVTSQVQACVCRNRVLYIDDFHSVLGLPPKAEGVLTLVYTVGKDTNVVVVHMKDPEQSHALLLSGYGNSCEAEAITTFPNGISSGYLYYGSILREGTDVSHLKGTVIAFNHVDGAFSCQIYNPEGKPMKARQQPPNIPKQNQVSYVKMDL